MHMTRCRDAICLSIWLYSEAWAANIRDTRGRPGHQRGGMVETLRLMVVAAHAVDDALGFGAVLARYASEGVETSLVTATRGERGRYLDHRPDTAGHPGAARLAEMRERELREAAAALDISNVTVLDYEDQRLDRAHEAGA